MLILIGGKVLGFLISEKANNLGVFIMGLAAMLGANTFRMYRRQKRSEAATEFLAIVYSTVIRLKDIGEGYHLYQYIHIDEKGYLDPVFNKSHTICYSYRPSRLINNQLVSLREQSLSFLAQFPSELSKKILSTIQKFAIDLRSTSNAIHADLENKKDLLDQEHIQNNLKNISEKLDKFEAKIYDILKPYIN